MRHNLNTRTAARSRYSWTLENVAMTGLFCPLYYTRVPKGLVNRCFFFFFLKLLLSSPWTSRVHRCCPFFPPALAFNFIAHRIQHSHCSSIFHRVLLSHVLALSASQFVHKKKSPRICMHSAGLELTKLTYTRLEDNLIRHRGDRLLYMGTERFN